MALDRTGIDSLRPDAAHRMRERGELVTGARGHATERNRRATGVGREPPQDNSAIADRERVDFGHRRTGRVAGSLVDTPHPLPRLDCAPAGVSALPQPPTRLSYLRFHYTRGDQRRGRRRASPGLAGVTAGSDFRLER